MFNFTNKILIYFSEIEQEVTYSEMANIVYEVNDDISEEVTGAEIMNLIWCTCWNYNHTNVSQIYDIYLRVRVCGLWLFKLLFSQIWIQ